MAIRILYCEDEDLLRDMVVSQLEECFHKPFIIQALNGFEGYEQFQSTSFDLIISDYDMKTYQGDGLSLYKKIREINPNINFVMLTSMNEDIFSEVLRDTNFHYAHKGQILEGKSIGDILSNLNIEKDAH